MIFWGATVITNLFSAIPIFSRILLFGYGVVMQLKTQHWFDFLACITFCLS